MPNQPPCEIHEQNSYKAFWLGRRCDSKDTWQVPDEVVESAEVMLPIWAAMCDGQPPPALATLRPAAADGLEETHADRLAWTEAARVEKYLKSRLAVAADHFNRDYKKGFQFLVVRV